MRRCMGGRTSPATPPKSIEIAPPAAACRRIYFNAGRKREEGGQELKGLAVAAATWPSGLRRARSSRARPSQPNQTVQVAGSICACIRNGMFTSTSASPGGERVRSFLYFSDLQFTRRGGPLRLNLYLRFTSSVAGRFGGGLRRFFPAGSNRRDRRWGWGGG